MDFWGFFWPWKLTFIVEWTLILKFCFLGDLSFFTRCLYLHHNWWKKRGAKINSSTIFEGCYLNLRKKTLKFIDTVDSQQFEYSKNWTTYKPLLKTFQKGIKLSHWSLKKKSHSITRTLIALKNLCFILIITLSIFGFWVIKSQLFSFLH